jgi:hypothetical protein
MDGTVCISILHPPGEDKFNEQEKDIEKYELKQKILKQNRRKNIKNFTIFICPKMETGSGG